MTKNLLFSLLTIILISSNVKAQMVYKDVAPIFFNKCATCHHPGSTYPYFSYYGSIAGHSSMIQYDLNTNKMPPWPPDTTYTRFQHERILTLSEKNKILSWIASGSLPGDTTMAVSAPVYPTTKLVGTPDLILTIPTYTSNASTSDKYVCISIPTGLSIDRILRAYEVVPGNPSIVHHAVINVDTMGTTTTDLSGSCYAITGDFSLGGYAPGGAPTVFPGAPSAKFGINIKAGSKIVLQMHYPAGSVGQTDNTQIRLFFYPVGTTGVRRMYAATPLQNWSFFIPANGTQTVTATYPSSGLAAPISIYSIFPHSHKVCTKIVNYAINGSTVIPLCRINKWDFEWQSFYTFPNFVKIPAGFKLKGVHDFNNTSSNPFAPVSTSISAGVATSDEMVFDGLMWADYLPGDELIDIAAILAADTLFLAPVGVKEIKEETHSISVYPNPFTDTVKLFYDLTKTEFVSVSFYNTLGQEVALIPSGLQVAGKHSLEWDGKSNLGEKLAQGVYSYKIKIGVKSYTGKVVLK